MMMPAYHDHHRCAICGCRFEDHRASNGCCPPTMGHGHPAPFPRIALMSDAEADKALVDYWAAASRFVPRV